MLDIFHLQDNPRVEQKIFNASTAPGSYFWQTWHKPRGVSFAHFLLIGPGGGGNAGFAGASAAAGGGGGGASGSVVSMILPLWMFPDVLFINVPVGGAPGALPVGSTVISLVPVASVQDSAMTLMTADCGSFIGSAGSATAGGSGGQSGTIQAWTNPNIVGAARAANPGFYNVNAVTASAGGFNGSPTALALASSGSIVMPGTGGGGLGNNGSTGNAGGAYTAPTGITNILNIPAPGAAGGTTTANGGNGTNGSPNVFMPGRYNFFFGGTGGASGGGAGGNGGNGGAGGIGCGGGGGGGCLTGFTPGTGGRGGDGLLVVTCW